MRYLSNDDERQARRALALLEQTEAVFLPKTVLLELECCGRPIGLKLFRLAVASYPLKLRPKLR